MGGDWGSWSACNEGSKERTRSCNNPEPSDGGSECPESDTETGDCGCATIYDDVDMGGPFLDIDLNEEISCLTDEEVTERTGLKGWNDKMSSVRVLPGCVLTAYKHCKFNGHSLDFTAGDSNLDQLNNKISSLKCFCGAR